MTMSVAVDAQANGVLNLGLGLSGRVLIGDKLYRDEIKLIMQSVPDNRDKGGRGINIWLGRRCIWGNSKSLETRRRNLEVVSGLHPTSCSLSNALVTLRRRHNESWRQRCLIGEIFWANLAAWNNRWMVGPNSNLCQTLLPYLTSTFQPIGPSVIAFKRNLSQFLDRILQLTKLCHTRRAAPSQHHYAFPFLVDTPL